MPWLRRARTAGSASQRSPGGYGDSRVALEVRGSVGSPQRVHPSVDVYAADIGQATRERARGPGLDVPLADPAAGVLVVRSSGIAYGLAEPHVRGAIAHIGAVDRAPVGVVRDPVLVREHAPFDP